MVDMTIPVQATCFKFSIANRGIASVLQSELCFDLIPQCDVVITLEALHEKMLFFTT